MRRAGLALALLLVGCGGAPPATRPCPPQFSRCAQEGETCAGFRGTFCATGLTCCDHSPGHSPDEGGVCVQDDPLDRVGCF